MNIDVHIERMVLDGLPVTAGQSNDLQAAVEAELARLLLEGGLAPEIRSGGTLRSVRADDIVVATGNNPSILGRQIAQSVYRGIGETK